MSRVDYGAKIRAMIVLSLALAACTNSGTGGGRNQYTIQINAFGAALGSAAAALTVTETNSGQSVTFTGSAASQTLNHEYASGDSYNLSITNPTEPAQTCVAASGGLSGEVSGNLTLDITCTIVQVQVSGSVSGLQGSGLVLQFNGTPASEPISPTSNGSFSFSVPSGTTPQVSVATQPTSPAQTCAPAGASPPQTISAPVTGLSVACTTTPFTVFGNVTGLIGSGLTLTDSVPGTPPLSLLPGAPGNAVPFSFSIPSGATYTIAQASAPSNPTQSCTPASGPAANITVGNSAPTGSILITCTTATYPVSFTVAGTSGLGVQVTLLVDGNPYSSLLVGCNTGTANCPTNTFPLQVNSGSSYKVIVSAQNDPTQNCYVWNIGGSGTIVASAPPTATVVCAPIPQYAFAPGFNLNSATSTYVNSVFYYTINPTSSASAGNLVASTLNQSGIFTQLPSATSAEVFASASPGEDFVAQGASGSPSTIVQYDFQNVFLSPASTPTTTSVGSVNGTVQDMQYDAQRGVLYICYLSTSPAGLYFETINATSGALIGQSTSLSANGTGCTLHLAKSAIPSTAPLWLFAYYTDSGTQTYDVYEFSLASVNLQTAPAPALASLAVATVQNPTPSGVVASLVLNAGAPQLGIDPTGRFIYVPQITYGNPPNCIQILPPPFSIYYCIPNQTTIQGYVIGQATSGNQAGLTPIPATNALTFFDVTSLLFEPSGHLVYVPDLVSLYPLAIDQTTGVLSYARQPPLTPSQLIQDSVYSAIDPSGSYIFLNSGKELLTYTVNPADGSLYELPPLIISGSGQQTYGTPVVDPSGQFLYISQYTYSSISNSYVPNFSAYTITSDGLVPLTPPPTVLPSTGYTTNQFLMLQ
jgi:hypothetical protein